MNQPIVIELLRKNQVLQSFESFFLLKTGAVGLVPRGYVEEINGHPSPIHGDIAEDDDADSRDEHDNNEKVSENSFAPGTGGEGEPTNYIKQTQDYMKGKKRSAQDRDWKLIDWFWSKYLINDFQRNTIQVDLKFSRFLHLNVFK